MFAPNPILAQSDRQRTHPAAAGTPETLAALCNAAFAHHRAGRFGDAIGGYRRILSIHPGLAVIHNNLGHALAALGKPEAAIAEFAAAIALHADNPEALCNWGVALAELGRIDEAEAKYRQAIRINPGFSGAYNNLGLLLKHRGRLPEAQRYFEQAIRLEPKNVSFYDNLAAVRPFVAGDPYLTALEVLAEDSASLSGADQIHLHFALAKAYENTGQHERAFRHLLNANRRKRRQMTYDESATLGEMDRLRELTSRDFIRTRQDCGDPSPLPVFIIGMTRSGTTLIEQILASHPQVFGAGELDLFDRATDSLRRTLPGSPAYPEMMLGMSAEHFRGLGARYREAVAQLAPGAMRVTDKMTANFLFAGLIHLALPNATIIHAVRDAADTCVSCFAVDFSNGNAHTYDLAELGRYYRHYRALMAHWHEVLPRGRILDVHYEELVSDLEGAARRIVAHCGLAWDARCLEFHRTQRPVRTASAAQVRKPIYRDSLGRWRKYEAFLGPLLRELDV